MGNAIIPMKMFKKGHNRFPEITEFFFKSEGNYSLMNLNRLNYSLLCRK